MAQSPSKAPPAPTPVDLPTMLAEAKGYLQAQFLRPIERAVGVIDAAVYAEQVITDLEAKRPALERAVQEAEAAAGAAQRKQAEAETEAARVIAAVQGEVAATRARATEETRRLEGALAEARTQHRAALDALTAERAALQADADRRLAQTLKDLAEAQQLYDALQKHVLRTPR